MRAQRAAMHSAESEATTTRPKTSYTQRCRSVISVEIFSSQGYLDLSFESIPGIGKSDHRNGGYRTKQEQEKK